LSASVYLSSVRIALQTIYEGFGTKNGLSVK